MDFSEARSAIERIRGLAQTRSPIVIALDGRSGTGKSTLSAWIAAQVGASVIDQDDFYAGGEIDAWEPLTAREKADRVIDWRRVRAEALQPLRAGVGASWHPFNWETLDGLAPGLIKAEPSNKMILDGAYSSRPELADLIDLSILVTLPDAVRRARLMLREGDELVSEWHAVWDEAEEYYFGTVRPPEAFDLVINRPFDAGEDPGTH